VVDDAGLGEVEDGVGEADGDEELLAHVLVLPMVVVVSPGPGCGPACWLHGRVDVGGQNGPVLKRPQDQLDTMPNHSLQMTNLYTN
jgi:hypothetical protein